MTPREQAERTDILAALNATNGDVKAAAELLHMSERTLYRRIERYALRPRVTYEAVDQAA